METEFLWLFKKHHIDHPGNLFWDSILEYKAVVRVQTVVSCSEDNNDFKGWLIFSEY